MPTVKACTKCGEVKPLDEFYKDKRRVDGRRPHCKKCVAEYRRRYREENPEKEREQNRRYYEKNREGRLEQRRRRYEENSEKERERSRRYREENREAILEKERERNRRYYEENREVVTAKILLHMATCQELTKALSSVQAGTLWSEEEDELLMADNGMTAYQKATHLGRTYDSCVHRHKKLKNLRRTTNA